MTLASLVANPGFTSTFQLYAPLSVSGSLTLNSEFALRGNRPSPPAAQGTVEVLAPATADWHAGTLYDVTVRVQRAGPSNAATMRVFAPTGVRRQANSKIEIDGRLDWTAGDVQVLATYQGVPKSRLQVNTNGVVNIGGTAGTWGLDDPDRLDVANAGMVDANLVAGGTTTLIGNYTTSGTTRVRTGTFVFGGSAEQTGGSFELHNNGTARMAGQAAGQVQVLRIRNGTIVGTGTVDGKLTLGYENGTGAGSIAPGFNTVVPGMPPTTTRVPGTLAITQSFQMFSANSSMQIDVLGRTDAGGNRLYDLITVGGQATLSGALTVWIVPTFTDNLNSPRIEFLTTGAGILGNFASVTITGPPMWQQNGKGRVWGAGKDLVNPMTYYILVVGPP